MRSQLVMVVLALVPAVVVADVRHEKRTELLARETLRIMKRAESQTALNGRDFAKAWRRGIAKTIRETCACRDRYIVDRRLRAHCALDAMTEMMLDLMPVLFRVPGVLEGWKRAMREGERESERYGERVTMDLLEEWVPAKERLRTMKRLHECFE